MKDFKGLSGEELEKWFLQLFKTSLGFTNYYKSTGQIKLSKLGYKNSGGSHIELDALLFVNKTGIILEYTSEDAPKDKLKKFLKNIEVFKKGKATLKEKLKLFNIKGSKLSDFEEVKKWKYVFIGTNESYESFEFKASDYQEYSSLVDNLTIIKPTHVEYLKELSNLINRYAQHEFLSAVGLTPKDLGDDETIRLEFQKLDGKYITADNEVKADLYLLKFKVKQLLTIARVSRYEGIPFILYDEDGDEAAESYQRLLLEDKLRKISKDFISKDKRKTFPNAITVVLSNDCKEIKNPKRLEIPKRYSSIDIIDGQHRLFAYTQKVISDETRDEAEIFATAIKFRDLKGKDIIKYSAKVFVDVNSNQAKVKNNLIYLIKYDVLEDRDEFAIAGKVLLECDRGSNALSKMFATNSLRRFNKLNTPPIPIVTIIENDLVPLLRGINPRTGGVCSDEAFKKAFGKSRTQMSKSPEEFYKKTKAILDQYFNNVKSVFTEDWKLGSGSLLISSKYYTAFIRLLRYYLFEENLTVAETKKELLETKKKIDALTKPTNSPSLPKANTDIPPLKLGIDKIYKFLRDPKDFKLIT